MKKWFAVLLHIGYWLLYLLLLLTVLQLVGRVDGRHRSIATVLYRLFMPPLLWTAILPAVLSFYIFYTVIFSRLLQRKKMAALLWVGPAVVASVSLFPVMLVYLDPPLKKALSAGELLPMFVIISVLTLIHGVIALVMKGFVSWYGDIRLKERLMQRNDEMELALVKSQLNPHFLFNTLNNIDVLIGRDADLASAYLNKLSDILRFILYETKTEKIPLEKELLYIGKYIHLQKIRTSNPDHIQYTVEGEPGGWTIAPMIFIPFIENAFKHADNKRTAGVRISVHIEKDMLNFCCENSYVQRRDAPPDHSGLGNDLIRKRLKLLYPDSHVLEISDTNDIYKAKLVLNGNAH